MGFCTVSFLKFLEIWSKLVGIEAIWRERQVHAEYIYKTSCKLWKQVLPLNPQSSSKCIYSLKRRNKHIMCLVIAIDVIYSLQPLFSRDLALDWKTVSRTLLRLRSPTLQ